MPAFSEGFDIPRITTKRQCYIEVVNQNSVFHTAAFAAAGLPIGDCNVLNMSQRRLSGGGALSVNAGNISATTSGGSHEVTVRFKRPVTGLRILHAGNGGGERIQLPATDVRGVDFELSGTIIYNAANNSFHNNNAGPSYVDYLKPVTEVKFIVVSQAGLSSVSAIDRFVSTVHAEVICVEGIDGSDPRIFAICGKGDIADITTAAGTIEDAVNPAWIKCEDVADTPSSLDVPSNFHGMFFHMKSGSTVTGFLPVTAGTVANGALENPLWAAKYPEFVSGNDIVFPANVDDMFLRNIGGEAAAEGVFQSSQNLAHTHTVQRYQNLPTNLTQNGAGARWRGTSNVQSSSSGGAEARPKNRAYQLYTVIDSYRDKILVNTIQVDQTFDAELGFNPTDIHGEGNASSTQGDVLPANLNTVSLEAGWSHGANVARFAGSPDKVIGSINVVAPDSGASNNWSYPVLRVIRNGDVIEEFGHVVMIDSGAYDGTYRLNVPFVDKTPGTDPVYTFEWFNEEARTSTLIPRDISRIHLSAVNRVSVATA